MNNYDIHLFDWDGTITNSMSIWLDIMRDETQRFGISMTDTELHECSGDWALLVKYGLDAAHVPVFSDRARAAARERVPQAPLQPAVREVIMFLKRNGKKLGVVTASHRMVMEKVLAAHGFDTVFDVVICGSEVKKQKPDPEGVLLALERLRFVPGTPAIMWGDADRDLLAAERAGIQSGLFFPPDHARYVPQAEVTKDCQPAVIVHSWQEFLDQLQKGRSELC